MLPEPLVTIAEYAAPELAAPDKAKLDADGITAYVGGLYYRHWGRVEIKVPESEVVRARRILEIAESAPDSGRPLSPPRCPDCGSDQSREIPPYAFYAMAGAFCLGFLWCIAARSPIGVAVILPGWALALWFSRDAGKRRCTACGRKWKP